MKRFISAEASDIIKFTKDELKQSIKASEGRVIVSENVVTHEPYIHDITDSEIAVGFGADLVLLNAFDVFNPIILGMYGYMSLLDAKANDNVIKDLKKLIGRPIGINLEPVDDDSNMLETKLDISNGRKVSKESLIKARELGIDFICLTGNPGTGVSNEKINSAIKLAKEHFKGLIIAGKMHGAGVDEPVIDNDVIVKFIESGADVILVPALGTVYGVSEEDIKFAVKQAHLKGALVMSAIGTSQETSSINVIEQFGISNKIIGVDMQHIGDAGPAGITAPENIMALSSAIRGKRHTISRMCRSINR